MIQVFLSQISLFIWVPIVVFIFVSRPPQRAVVVAFVFAWLFLPNIAWSLPGLPDYTKSSATIFGVLLCVALFDSERLLSLRPRWHDLPVIVFCLCPFAASISVGLGAYDGISAIIEQLIRWGFPYMIGRMYFNDLPSLRLLAQGVAIGGLVYVPLCLIEIRLSPQISMWVYGFNRWELTRYGGFRPKVFLSTGLELGMWMTCATLVTQRLWACGTIKTLGGYSFGKLTLALVVTTLLCKSTGALMLLMMGLGTLWMVTRTRSSWPVWLLIAVVPFYTSTRIAGLWSGREVLSVAKVFGEDRAQSLEFRMLNEDVLIDHALKHAIFGGGRKDGAQVYGSRGQVVTIVDGYWMIVFGTSGLVGLTSLVTMLLLPTVLLIRRHPVATWTQPEVAAAPALATMIALVMIDEVSNGMLNPIYAVIIGGLSSLKSAPRLGRLQEAEASLLAAIEMTQVDQPLEAEPFYRDAIELSESEMEALEGLEIRAEALEGLGSLLLPDGRAEEAEEALREAVAIREAIAAELADDDHDRALAIARGRLGRTLARLGRISEAITERELALEIWDRLASSLPDVRTDRAHALNDLAWLLSAETDPGCLNPSRAVRLAREAVRLDPELGPGWNTLGVACYRSGDWPGAVEALERSVAAGPPGGTAFDHFFLAMAFRQLGEEARAQNSFSQAVAWAGRHQSDHPDLARFRDEAAALLEKPRPTEVDVLNK